MYDIFEACVLVNEKTGNMVLFDYLPHVNGIGVRLYLDGETVNITPKYLGGIIVYYSGVLFKNDVLENVLDELVGLLYE